MRNDPQVTQELVRRMFDYNPLTGWLTIKSKFNQKVIPGRRAGYENSRTHYRHVSINCWDYIEHRVIWLYAYGNWPTGPIDHINHRRNDNRISNLRIATRTQNALNTTRSTGKSGIRGVWQLPSGRFRASLTVQIGTFDTKEEAGRAAYEARKKYHGSEYVPPNFFEPLAIDIACENERVDLVANGLEGA
jgi:hypothetical protein